MKRISRIVTLGMGVLGLFCGSVRAAEVGTAFSFQGELVFDGTPVDEACDFEFRLWNAPDGGTQIGQTVVRPSASSGVCSRSSWTSAWLRSMVRPVGSKSP